MIRDAGSGYAAQIGAEIESVRVAERFQRGDAPGKDREALRLLIPRQLLDLRGVAVRDDHHVAAIIGKAVQHHKAVLATPDDQVLGILAGTCNAAEEAGFTLRRALERLDICRPPRGVEMFQGFSDTRGVGPI